MELNENSPKALLDYFFDFLNFDLNKLGPDNLTMLAMAYVRFAYHGDSTTSQEKYINLTRPVFDESGLKLNEIKATFEKLQEYFRGRINAIIYPTESEFFIKQKGTRTVKIIDGKFIGTFQTVFPPSNKFDWKLELPFIETALANIIINDNLEPGLFNNCDNCDNYFYQKTKRITKFCSPKCSNASRQRRFQQKTGGFVVSETGKILAGWTGGGMSPKELDQISKMTKRITKKK